MRPKNLRRTVFLAAVLSFSLLVCAETPSITGQVVDPTGAPVAGAHVLLIELHTLGTRLVTADAEGRFSFTGLTRSDYELKVASQGFVTYAEQVSFDPTFKVVVVPEPKPVDRITLKITLKIGSTT